MPVDTSIYNNIRPFQVEDPIARASRAVQLQGGMMQLEDAKRRFSLEDDISGALAESGGDLTKASQALAQRGRGQASLSLLDKASAQKKAETDQKLKLMEAVGSDGIALDAAYRDALGKTGGDQVKAVAAIQPIYNQVRARWAQMGHQLPEQFDPVGNLAGIGQAKEVASYLKGLRPEPSDLGKLLAERDAIPRGDPRRKPYDDAIGKRTEDPTELARLMKERDALPDGDAARATYDRVLANYKGGRGTDVTVNTGPMTPGKEGANKVDEAILKTTGRLAQVFEITSKFRPEFQRLGTKVDNAITAGKDILGMNLTNKEKQDLDDYNAFRASAGELYAQTLKEMAGTALTEGEVKIHSAYLPRPGTGLTDGDSPREMKTKIDRLNRTLKMAAARLTYMKRNGMSLDDGKGGAVVPLDRMPTLIEEKGRALEAEMKGQYKDGAELNRAVRRRLAEEFGLASD